MTADADAPAGARRRTWVLLVLLALVAMLPDLRAALPLDTYYFRDFTLAFYPLRAFQAHELRAGRLPFWNPYFNEGAFHLPALYPPDLLHVLAPGPVAVSWLLSLHLPLAALTAWALARDRGATRAGAFVTGCVYSLGGFALSTLNLYIFLQALALAPLVLLTLGRAAARGGRWVAWAALSLALSLSTLALEIVAQAVALGLILALVPRRPAAGSSAVQPTWTRAGAHLLLAVALGVGLAGVPVAVTLGVLPETSRGAGFGATHAAAYSWPPVALLQTFVAHLFGPLDEPLRTWWGSATFGLFPYFISFFLGPVTLALLPVGAAQAPRPERVVLVGATVLSVWYAIGPAGGLWHWLHAVPGLSTLRFPSKSLFAAHLAAALLAGRGVDRLIAARGWQTFGRWAGLAVVTAVGLAAAVQFAGPSVASWLSLPVDAFQECAPTLLADLARSGLAALLALVLAATVHRGYVRPPAAVAGLTALIAFDLARAGAGLNTQTRPSYFDLVPALQAQHLDQLGDGRVYVHPPLASPNYREWLAARAPGVDLAAFYFARQVLDPYNNVIDGVETAASLDRTGFIPQQPELDMPDNWGPRLVTLLPRLRHAAVTRVLSYEALPHPDLRLRAQAAIGHSGLTVNVYELLRSWPRAYVACQVRVAATRAEAAAAPYREGFDPERDVALEGDSVPSRRGSATVETGCSQARVETLARLAGEERYRVDGDGAGYLVVRSSHARGWRATVDGRPVEVLRADGRYRAVPVTAGRHEVELRYHPPGLTLGLALTVAAGVGLLVVVLGPSLRRNRAGY